MGFAAVAKGDRAAKPVEAEMGSGMVVCTPTAQKMDHEVAPG
jgi:hypothetical protein